MNAFIWVDWCGRLEFLSLSAILREHLEYPVDVLELIDAFVVIGKDGDAARTTCETSVRMYKTIRQRNRYGLAHSSTWKRPRCVKLNRKIRVHFFHLVAHHHHYAAIRSMHESGFLPMDRHALKARDELCRPRKQRIPDFALSITVAWLTNTFELPHVLHSLQNLRQRRNLHLIDQIDARLVTTSTQHGIETLQCRLCYNVHQCAIKVECPHCVYDGCPHHVRFRCAFCTADGVYSKLRSEERLRIHIKKNHTHF